MDREHIVHRDHFQIVFSDGGILWKQLLVKLELVLLAHKEVEEHRILRLTVHAILLHDIKLMLIGIPLGDYLCVGLFLLSHRSHLLFLALVSA